MCDFCDYIFDYPLLYARTRGNSKKKQMQDKEREIFKNKGLDGDSNYLIHSWDGVGVSILASTGDPFCEGCVEDIKYCPYCGRELMNE